MREITAPLAELPDDPVASVTNQDFPVVLRGYDRIAVDAYVKRAAQLVAELYAGRSPEGAVRRALERVGDQVSEILKRAHDTAEELTAQSRSEAEERLMRARDEAEEILRQAHQQAHEITKDAEHRARSLDSEVDHIWVERDRIVGDVRRLAEDLTALASAAATRFPPAPADEEAPAVDDVPPAAVDDVPPAVVDDVPRAAVDEVPPAAAQPTLIDEPVLEEEPTEDRPALVDEPTVVAPAIAIPRVIELEHLGRERVIGCWQIGDVLVDPGPASCLDTLLAALDGAQPAALLLTHIHLDHAGAAGSLVKYWPDLEVYVHESGAPHLIDPTRLLESARRLYGDDMDRLWGEVLPVPEENIRVLRGGERIIDDCFDVAYMPGHASHHVAFFYDDDGTAFVGDVAGVRITPQTLTIPPTPPPDIDIEAWHASIDRVAAWKPDRLAITHFGANDDVDAQLAEVSERLDTWAALAHTEDLDTFVDAINEEIVRDAGPELLAAYNQAAVPEQLYAGLERYWSKRGPRDVPAPASTHAGRASRADPPLS